MLSKMFMTSPLSILRQGRADSKSQNLYFGPPFDIFSDKFFQGLHPTYTPLASTINDNDRIMIE
jgi:hypothetical protein